MMKHNKLTAGSNLKWEASRMILPEHREQILQHQQQTNQQQKPILDEQRLDELSQQLLTAVHQKDIVKMTVYSNYCNNSIIGSIKKLDYETKRIQVQQKHDTIWISLSDILNITSCDPPIMD